MYRVEPKHRFVGSLTRADYIQPLDYIRPIVGTWFVGLSYITILTAICVAFHPTHFSLLITGGTFGLVYSTIMYTFLGFVIAAVNHSAWLYRLKTSGPQAYERQLSLKMPPRQAFELCLAAASAIDRPTIKGFDEQSGHLRIVSGRPWWSIYESSQIDIQLRPLVNEDGTDATELKMSAQKSLTSFRLNLLRIMLGEKWLPLVLATGNWHQHVKLMDNLTDYIGSHPTWNYQHIPGSIAQEASCGEETEKLLA